MRQDKGPFHRTEALDSLSDDSSLRNYQTSQENNVGGRTEEDDGIPTAVIVHRFVAQYDEFIHQLTMSKDQSCCSDGWNQPEYRTLSVSAACYQARGKTQASRMPAFLWLTLQDMVCADKALIHVRISRVQLWLGVCLALSAYPLSGHAQPHTHPEVVIPLRVSATSGDIRSPTWLSYSMRFGGQRHIAHLKVKRVLVSSPFSVFTYTKQGALQEDQPFIPMDCYYYGYVEGDPESMVAINTCLGGFQGTIQINNTSYEIKPKNLSSTFEHLIYKLDSNDTQQSHMRCGLTEEELQRQMKFQDSDNTILMQSGYEGWWTHEHFVEVAVVVDNNHFVHRKRNATIIQIEALTIFVIINEYYTSLETDVFIRGLEIWTERNPIHIKGNMSDIMRLFCDWKANIVHRLPHDSIQFIVRHSYGILVGLGYVKTVCGNKYNCGINSFANENIKVLSHVMAHEVGHNLGMYHDNKTCVCGQRFCIMYEYVSDSRRWSNCSYGEAYNTFMTRACIRNIPKPLKAVTKKHEVCGNGVVEDGEVCDCGSKESCMKDPCCMADCTLKNGSDCAVGGCCKDCRFVPSGTLCRDVANECDLPEWCNGTSQECPHDVYMQGGSPCKDNNYCYEKKCHNREEQCHQIFGNQSRSAEQRCYKEVNLRGDRFGNCGMTARNYLRCHPPHVLCGRIQCVNVTDFPNMKGHTTVHLRQVDDITCWGIDYHWGLKTPDVGEVEDGNACGVNKMCLRRKCVPLKVLQRDCNSKTCKRRGVCNNKGHCHCDVGWKPPNCLTAVLSFKQCNYSHAPSAPFPISVDNIALLAFMSHGDMDMLRAAKQDSSSI
uniref:disintegrin and metalloproteinase domain-containing protein 20-like n=1 Tax=Jaculus jaculus TaxID=51337 RepID=UPI001E1B0C66|nr:disintegrin and metalloproteinase domain-containing protein 20-like [Jaculus jaculus]